MAKSAAAGARAALGLGAAAIADVGAGAGTVAAGNDSRIAGAAQKSANLSDLADLSAARANLGLANVQNKASATILAELAQSHLDAAAGSRVVRVASGTADNSGRISWGAGAVPTLAEGELYLRHA